MVINADAIGHMIEKIVSTISWMVVVGTAFGVLPELKASIKRGSVNKTIKLDKKTNFFAVWFFRIFKLNITFYYK